MALELLAPAGDMDALKAAVQCGADAVYLGASKFSARRNAANFDKEELSHAVAYCHIRGVKVYLALNTLLVDEELEEALSVAGAAYESGIDAFIVQDNALIRLLIDNVPVPLHGSTQMTVFDEYGMQYLKERGLCRAVLARECKKEDIGRLAKRNLLELEVFCHGALCMSYSGQCLMSSFLGGRSANRGACAQPCRLPYQAGGDTGYFLSPRDLCLIDELLELSRMGVASVKIEGRMKSAAYVAAVVSAYRKWIDTGYVDRLDYDNMHRAFSRGGRFTKGLYAASSAREMMNTASSNDDVLKTANREFVKQFEPLWTENKERRKTAVSATLRVGEKSTDFCLSDGEREAHAAIDTPHEVRGQALTEEFAKTQLTKLGATAYEADNFHFYQTGDAYFSAAALNSLRREAAKTLDNLRAGRRMPLTTFRWPQTENRSASGFAISAIVSDEEQAKALLKEGVRTIVPLRLAFLPDIYAAFVPAVYEALPEDVPCRRIMAGSVGAWQWAKMLGKEVLAGYSMNVTNRVSAALFEPAVLSPELTLKQCAFIAKAVPSEVIGYGYLPLMTSRVCMVDAAGRCKKKQCNTCEKAMVFSDRKQARFRVIRRNGLSVLHNSVPLFMADRLEELKRAALSGIQLYFTGESPEECVRIYRMYAGLASPKLPPQYTRGHFYRGC